MTTAVDITSGQIPALVRLLASSATLRGHIGATTYAAAQDLIGEFEVSDVDDPNNQDQVASPRPRAWISKMDWGIRRNAVGQFVAFGNLKVNIELIPPDEIWTKPNAHNIKAEHRWFDEEISAILAEMCDTFNALDTGDSLPIYPFMRAPVLNYGPCDQHEETQWFWGAVFEIPYAAD